MGMRFWGALALIAMPELAASAHERAPPPAEIAAERMALRADRLIALLTAQQRAVAMRRFDDSEARTNWNYLPSNLVRRDGMPIAELNAAQRIELHGLLSAGLSSQGYGKATQIMWLETVLHRQQQAELMMPGDSAERIAQKRASLAARDPEKYWISLFGTPRSRRWGWMLSGHHLALNFTVVDSKVAFTPLFKGANPQIVMSGPHAGVRTLQVEIEGGGALAATLDAAQRRSAVIAPVVLPAMFADKGKKGDRTVPIGLSGAKMTPVQQRMLRGLIAEYLGDIEAGPAAAQWRKIERDGLAALHFAWWGPIDDPAQRFMYRIHGPSIMIEFLREAGPEGGPGNHVHAIMRDPANDYGEDWLGRHYREAHQPALP